jgi:hypothetical protein
VDEVTSDGPEPAVLVTTRASRPTAVPGSRQSVCSRCGEAVWISPSSEPMVARGARPLCVPCAVSGPGPDRIEPLTDRQRDEIRRALAE